MTESFDFLKIFFNRFINENFVVYKTGLRLKGVVFSLFNFLLKFNININLRIEQKKYGYDIIFNIMLQQKS